jgi:hypothetical protein
MSRRRGAQHHGHTDEGMSGCQDVCGDVERCMLPCGEVCERCLVLVVFQQDYNTDQGTVIGTVRMAVYDVIR